MKILKYRFAAAAWLAASLAAPARAGVDYDLSAANPAYTVSYNGTGGSTLLQNCGTAGTQIDRPLGDLNGDGIPDAVMTDRNADTQGRTNNGAVFIQYGRLEGAGGRDRVLSSSFSVRIDGASTSDVLDFCWVEDLNADGQDDLLIRAFTPGNMYVLYGPLPAGPSAVIDLQTAANYNLKFVAPTNWGVGGAYFFDLNADGVLDLFMDYANADTNGTDAGAIYVVYGPLPAETGSDKPLSTASSYNLRIDGTGAVFLQRPWVADLNDDGAPDLVVAAPNGDSFGRTDNGIVYVTTGPYPTGTGNVWRTSNVGRWQVAIHGVSTSDFLFLPITGDFTGDGAEDLCVGSEWADTGGTDRGGYWCIYGPFAYAMDSHLDLGIPGAFNVRFEPDTNSDRLALDDPLVADTNADGVDDLIIVSRIVDVSGVIDSGAAYVFHGGPSGVFPSGTGNVRDLGLTSSYNLRIRSSDTRDRIFYALPRDVDRDGVKDLIVLSEGEDIYSCAASDDGYVAVYFGPTPSATGGDRNIRSDYDIRLHHSNCSLTADGLHGAVADFDGDGWLDVSFAREGHSSFGFTNNGRLWFVSLATATPRLQAPGLFTNDDTPTLSWTTSPGGATSYHVQLDDDPLFGSLAAENTNVTGTSWTLSSSLSNGETYYVRVKALNGSLTNRWGPLHTFTVDTTAPTAPTLLSPGDASGTHPQVGTPTPTFDWSEASTE